MLRPRILIVEDETALATVIRDDLPADGMQVICATPAVLAPFWGNAEDFSADVWADNWFDLRIDGSKVAEASGPITTERSFNAEGFSFQADRPFTIGPCARGFIKNNAGVEYIGTGRQQMGDGGGRPALPCPRGPSPPCFATERRKPTPQTACSDHAERAACDLIQSRTARAAGPHFDPRLDSR